MKKTLATVALVATSASAMLYAAHAQEATTGAKLTERQPLSVEKSIEKLSDGIRITQTAKDAATLTRLHAMADKQNLMSQIETVVTNVDNGVKITRTSTNSEAVTFLQEQQKPEMKDRPEKEGESAHPEITRTQTNITNGVEILITSTDAEAVTKIQEMEAKMGEHKGKGPMMGHGKDGKDRKNMAFPGKKGGARGGSAPVAPAAS